VHALGEFQVLRGCPNMGYPADFVARQTKHEVGRKSFDVAADGTIQDSCFNAVKLRQITIEQNLMPTNQKDSGIDLLRRNHGSAIEDRCSLGGGGCHNL